MKISGLMKTTLLDFPGKVACTVFLAGCNFRCPFCHNGSLVRGGDEDISREELFAFLKKRVGILDGVCVTGGEPLLNPDVGELLAEIKALGFAVKLDTNGSRPELLSELVEKELVDYVAMDIKNAADRYPSACGVEIDIEKVKKSVEILKTSGVDHEFRTTVVKGLHSAADIAECAAWIGENQPYFLQNYKKSDDIIAPDGLEPFSDEELSKLLSSAQKFNPLTTLRGT